jgi:hypothetical protein
MCKNCTNDFFKEGPGIPEKHNLQISINKKKRWSKSMFCSECGTQNPDTNQFCKNCGNPLKKRQPQAVPPQPAAAYPPVAPVYAPLSGEAQQQTTPSQAPPGYSLEPVIPPTEHALTVAGVIGFFISLLSLIIYPYICGILAIVIGAGVIFKTRKRLRIGVIIAFFGLIIGLASIMVDIFYFSLFPPQPVTLMLFWLLP